MGDRTNKESQITRNCFTVPMNYDLVMLQTVGYITQTPESSESQRCAVLLLIIIMKLISSKLV